MLQVRSWQEFKDTGLFWWTNSILHMFGWSIVYDYDDNLNIIAVYPARVKFRGFSESINSIGYIKVTNYLKENIEQLAKEASE